MHEALLIQVVFFSFRGRCRVWILGKEVFCFR